MGILTSADEPAPCSGMVKIAPRILTMIAGSHWFVQL
jgi:hypothetical protein